MGSEPTGPVDPGADAGETAPMPPSYPPRRPGRAVSPHPDGHTPRSTHSGGTDGSGTTTGSDTSGSTADAGSPDGTAASDSSDHADPGSGVGEPQDGGSGPAGADHAGGARAGEVSARRRRSRRLRTSASVGVVTLASGLLFSLSAMSARQGSLPQDAGLVGLVRHQQQTVDQMMSGNQDLQAQIDALVADSAATPAPTPTSVLQLSSVAVTGPGLTVTLTDAPSDPVPDGARPDDLVVHQQDIEDVMNALWKGGAEAMTVQGKRVNGRTVIRCIGNVILVDGARFSPPYVVSAIGDPQAMQAALSSDERIEIYLQYVARYQLGWDVDVERALRFDAVTQDPGIKFAQVEDHG